MIPPAIAQVLDKLRDSGHRLRVGRDGRIRDADGNCPVEALGIEVGYQFTLLVYAADNKTTLDPLEREIRNELLKLCIPEAPNV